MGGGHTKEETEKQMHKQTGNENKVGRPFKNVSYELVQLL